MRQEDAGDIAVDLVIFVEATDHGLFFLLRASLLLYATPSLVYGVRPVVGLHANTGVPDVAALPTVTDLLASLLFHIDAIASINAMADV